MIPEQEKYHFELFTKVCNKLFTTSNLSLLDLEYYKHKYRIIAELMNQEKFDKMHLEMKNVIDKLEKKKAM